MKRTKCVLDIETEGLEPWKDRIICIGIKDVDSGKTIVFYNEDERQMLTDFIQHCKRRQYKEVVGYNLSFDLRFIFAKALKYGICGNGLFNAQFTDIMDNVRAVRRMYSYNKPGKLEQWLQFIFGNGKLRTGASVPELYKKGRISEIIAYNRHDVEMTYRLWKRIMKVLYDD